MKALQLTASCLQIAAQQEVKTAAAPASRRIVVFSSLSNPPFRASRTDELRELLEVSCSHSGLCSTLSSVVIVEHSAT